ncbi:DUF4865 family protein [Plastoroseomonas hellenica]|uniref:DUF4865 family protein n=1 Tax=Plastoroseomonas hellenica TaxID=2687306 RepID=UPI001BA89D2D|nr:DUF4865 family protein [Plastoroseomonas hellenica]MBR0644681.1 DUF4865 family protein [Plastoroseomonas hellenica]
MIAMQYTLTLPADYDMGIIDRRIAEKGPLLDDFPGLAFKAYLTARRDAGALGSRDNLYAPFYVWRRADGLNDFLCGPGFAALTQSFGRPEVKTWIPWRAELASGITHAAVATREIQAVPPSADLEALRRRESEDAVADVERRGALASVAGFEPAGWTRLRFRLWREAPRDLPDGVQAYQVGHLSLSAA